MARIPTRNEAVSWGPPPDPENPPPTYPGVSSKKFNPLEAQKCYAESIAKEKDSSSFHQWLSDHCQLPAYVGEKQGSRAMDMMPGYSSVWASYSKLGWEQGLSGRVLGPVQKTRPQSAGATMTRPTSQARSRPASALRQREQQIHQSESSPTLGQELTPPHIADSASWAALYNAKERALNAAGQHGHGASRLMRPASAPARTRNRCAAQHSGKPGMNPAWRLDSENAAEVPGRNNSFSSRFAPRKQAQSGGISQRQRCTPARRDAAARKDLLRGRDIVKEMLNANLTLL